LKLSHTAYDIEALGILFKHGEWGVEVTIECLENVAEKKTNSGYHTECSVRKAMLNPGGLLAASSHWIDAGKANADFLAIPMPQCRRNRCTGACSG
jgi:hypothetical protein